MRNNNRRFYNNKCEIFESLTTKQVQALCLSEIAFTSLAGFLYLRKANTVNNKLKVSRQMLIDSMKETLYLSQN
jgi:hypothetical protein